MKTVRFETVQKKQILNTSSGDNEYGATEKIAVYLLVYSKTSKLN